jgi:hypothetical protein
MLEPSKKFVLQPRYKAIIHQQKLKATTVMLKFSFEAVSATAIV